MACLVAKGYKQEYGINYIQGSFCFCCKAQYNQNCHCIGSTKFLAHISNRCQVSLLAQRMKGAVFIKFRDDGKFLLVCLYIDDLLYTGNDEVVLDKFKESIMVKFDMSNLERMYDFLGIDVIQSDADDCNPISTTAEACLKLVKDCNGKSPVKNLFRSASNHRITNPNLNGIQLLPRLGLLVFFINLTQSIAELHNTKLQFKISHKINPKFTNN
ncbi:hypothetical protein CR513_29016, partial [Mucuna pruriens]